MYENLRLEGTHKIHVYYVTMNSNDSIVLVIYDNFFNPVASYFKKCKESEKEAEIKRDCIKQYKFRVFWLWIDTQESGNFFDISYRTRLQEVSETRVEAK